MEGNAQRNKLRGIPSYHASESQVPRRRHGTRNISHLDPLHLARAPSLCLTSRKMKLISLAALPFVVAAFTTMTFTSFSDDVRSAAHTAAARRNNDPAE